MNLLENKKNIKAKKILVTIRKHKNKNSLITKVRKTQAISNREKDKILDRK